MESIEFHGKGKKQGIAKVRYIVRAKIGLVHRLFLGLVGLADLRVVMSIYTRVKSKDYSYFKVLVLYRRRELFYFVHFTSTSQRCIYLSLAQKQIDHLE